MIKTLVLFDVDGTLIDARGSGRWAMARAFEDVFGLAEADACAAGVRFDGMSDRSIMAAIGRNAALPPGELEARMGRLVAAFLVRLEEGLAAARDKRALPGVFDLLDRLAGVAGTAVGLATGNMRRGAFLKLASVGLDTYFEHGAFGDDAEERAAIARLARERFERILGVGIPAHEVVLVGDTVADVEAARSNGFRSIAVETGWTDVESLDAAGPDLLATDLTDFGNLMRFIFGSRG